VYNEWPRGRGLRAQIIYCIDVFARLVVFGLLLWGLLFMMLYLFGDVSPYPPHHR
jgi:hypothetical protein